MGLAPDHRDNPSEAPLALARVFQSLAHLFSCFISVLRVMSAWKPFSRPSNDPTKSLVLIFVLWKFVLVLLAVASPVPGYDTSSLILIRGHHLHASHRNSHSEFCTTRERFAINLVRWDAIYFVKTAERGYVNEQEWAFSWVFTRLIAFVASCMIFSYGMLIRITKLSHRFSIS